MCVCAYIYIYICVCQLIWGYFIDGSYVIVFIVIHIYRCFKQEGVISTLSGRSLKINKFTYLGSNISSTERDFSICLAKMWTAINRILILWKSDLANKIKWDFFPNCCCVNTSVWLHHMKKSLDGNCTKMLHAVLNRSYKQHPTKQYLYGHLPLISKTFQVGWKRHAWNCWRIKDKLISDVLEWTLLDGGASTLFTFFRLFSSSLLPCLSQCFSRWMLLPFQVVGMSNLTLYFTYWGRLLVPWAMFNGCQLSVISC